MALSGKQRQANYLRRLKEGFVSDVTNVSDGALVTRIERLEGLIGSVTNELRELRGFLGSPPEDIKDPPSLPSPCIVSLRETPSKSIRLTADFDAWWEGYPEKVGKGAARKAFTKALLKTSLDQLFAGLERYKRGKPVDRAWCHASTWLNQERWNDVLEPLANGHDRPVPGPRPPTTPAPTLRDLGLEGEEDGH